MKRCDLSTVMRRAWVLMRTTGNAFAVCLSKAWALYRLTMQLRDGIVSFCYEKVDGTVRQAKGTLKEVQYLIKGASTTDTVKTLRYFDVEANAFRSFKIENLITLY